MDQNKQETVILLHGLGETPLIMAGLAFTMQCAGYKAVNAGYPSTRHPVEELTYHYLEKIIHEQKGAQRIHFVTHSLGGILLHQYLKEQGVAKLGRVVMLGPPHHGSEVFNFYRRHPILSTFFGPVAQQAGTDQGGYMDDFDNEATYEVGIIAGCLSNDPFAPWVMPWPHDGRTTVEGSKLKGMKDHIVLATTHEFSTYNPVVAYQVLQFLRFGQFNHLMEVPPQLLETPLSMRPFWYDAWRPQTSVAA